MKLLIRTLIKNKAYTLINVVGLSLGIACAVILYLLVSNLTSIDDYHEKADRIYRVVTKSKNNGQDDYNSGVPVPLIDAMKNEFFEFEIVAPVYYILSGRVVIGEGNNQRTYEESEGIAYCDGRLYQLLDRKWINGNKETSLKEPNQVVLSESWALRYFKRTDIIGESLEIEGTGELVVTGVMEDYPVGLTDFPFEMLVSYSTKEMEFLQQGGWHSNASDFQCYVLLPEGEDIEKLGQRLPAFADKYYGEDRNDARTHVFQPLSDIHFDQNYSNFRYKTVSRTSVTVMILLAIFLLIIACINFINLSTAQATSRFREVGIRKVLGSSRSSIVSRFLVETCLITFLALLIALGLAELSLFKVNSFLDVNLSIDLIRSYDIWLFIICIMLIVTFGAGLYPGLVISGHQPSSTLKGGKGSTKGAWRKSLVIFQFVISQVLIIGTLILLSQLKFYKNAPVGFEREGIVNIHIPHNDRSKMEVFKNKLQQLSEIGSVSLAWGPPAWGGVSTTNVFYRYEGKREEMNAQVKMCDENYTEVFGLEIIAGEGLVASDSANRALINESFAKRMGHLEPGNAVGEIVSIWGKELPVSGVVKDFHTMSFRRQIEPVILYSDKSRYEISAIGLEYDQIGESLDRIEKLYTEVYGGYSFNYSFMDDTFANFYRSEEKMARMLMVFSGIAIFIGCIGLYGLVSFMATNRTKEIGIRKVLGASVGSVIISFSREFTVFILVAFIIAVPLAYFGMNSWLGQFVYRIDPHPLSFIIAMMFTLFIAMATIAYKSLKASLTNPVEALKEE